MMQWLMPIYTGIISALVGYLIAKLKAMQITSKAEHEALGALLRNDMFEIYETFRDSETVPVRIQEEMDSLYRAYHNLGYNNTGTKIHDEIMAKKTEV